MRRLRWDGTVSLGHVLTIIAMIVTAFSAIRKMDQAIATIDKRVAILETLVAGHQREILYLEHRLEAPAIE